MTVLYAKSHRSPTGHLTGSEHLESGEHVLAGFIAQPRGGKRLPVGKVVVLTVNGSSAKLEAGAGADAKGLAEEFARAKAVA